MLSGIMLSQQKQSESSVFNAIDPVRNHFNICVIYNDHIEIFIKKILTF